MFRRNCPIIIWVHWFLYVPVAALTIAGVTGFCPGLIIWRKIGLK